MEVRYQLPAMIPNIFYKNTISWIQCDRFKYSYDGGDANLQIYGYLYGNNRLKRHLGDNNIINQLFYHNNASGVIYTAMKQRLFTQAYIRDNLHKRVKGAIYIAMYQGCLHKHISGNIYATIY